jgi:hypothetical protein
MSTQQDTPGKKGPSPKNPFKGQSAEDVDLVSDPNMDLTEQNQFEDTGAFADGRDAGQFEGRGQPPLMKK